MSVYLQFTSDLGLDSRANPDKFWARLDALGVNVWDRDGNKEFTKISTGINHEVGLQLELVPVDNCNVSFGFTFRQSGEARLPKLQSKQPKHTFEELQLLTVAKKPMTVDHARSWQQHIDLARAESVDGYVRINMFGNTIFKELARQFGLIYMTNTFPELYDSEGIVVVINEKIGLHIARFEQEQMLSARIVDITKPVWG